MPNKIDLSSFTGDCSATLSTALGFISDAQKAQKAAADKASRVMAPATLSASEASSAKAIFESVNEQQDALVGAGLDPSVVCAKLLNYATTLAQSAKSRLIDASSAAL